MLEIEYVIKTHDEILDELGGLPGFAGVGRGGVDAALARVENHAIYNGINDVFGIAAMYTVAIARGHVFNDGNKRTGLTCALAYLEREGYPIPKTPELEEVVVGVACGEIEHDIFASYLSALWMMTQN
ncbi:type II toxin-antitoxin system death-on-curing family toxin [Burkholderia multivorans]|uniref:type II toxin-antitoxin system death-on-curing family toxin n=1 Tax=Burkholderia multivorans TaxID=87883 RepID=UPI0009BC4785|nr:type II toxin-antitoxin system death-on-curing family toxin [Burkholderia multivorans]MBU9184456.1 type II toxin-antitoxin system death-on-curing family toxin [Burkholderia multivorans]MBU9246854.1 type II toxin-antitoxin system death-on-curing family toxin [Burkholderia multivorans]MBU9317488.1 type II toxin-antitoxin system death-on-curing family toxin [Burkholderia multivorans]MCA8504457.1 type II toxin-antitoxin system death-on-curing family toxin [Burkholderia multivorans]MCL4663339.1 